MDFNKIPKQFCDDVVAGHSGENFVMLMSVGGMPVGLQLMGQKHEDARITGLARWFDETLKRGSA